MFAFPLFVHASSVYTLASCIFRCVPCGGSHFSGLFEDQLGSVKILKAFARSFLHVMDGSKVILSFLALAISFHFFCQSASGKLKAALM